MAEDYYKKPWFEKRAAVYRIRPPTRELRKELIFKEVDQDGFLPDESERMLNKIATLLDEKDLKSIWKEKKDKMLKEKVNLVNWMTNFIENYHEFL